MGVQQDAPIFLICATMIGCSVICLRRGVPMRVCVVWTVPLGHGSPYCPVWPHWCRLLAVGPVCGASLFLRSGRCGCAALAAALMIFLIETLTTKSSARAFDR